MNKNTALAVLVHSKSQLKTDIFKNNSFLISKTKTDPRVK